MKIILLGILLFVSSIVSASVVGISTHPLNEQARVLSAEMTGYMSQRNEMGMGLRYTQELEQDKLLDISASGGQDSRSLLMGTGVDFEILAEELYQPRVSFKPYFQYQKFEDASATVLGAAPIMRKGFSARGYEFFPYVGLPTGIKMDTSNNEFIYYASLSFGASMPFPWANNNHLLLSLEGNLDMGASSDYIGCLVSWLWK